MEKLSREDQHRVDRAIAELERLLSNRRRRQIQADAIARNASRQEKEMPADFDFDMI